MTVSWSRTLFGTVSSLVVWAAHFGIVYSLVGVGCDQGWQRVPLAGTNRLTVWLIVLTLLALAVILWIGWGGWRSYRQAGRHGEGEDKPRWRFLGLVTLTIAVLAFVATVMTAVPIMMLPPCE